MLSEWERRTLQEIEQQISRETPWFEASMQSLLSDPAHKWANRGYDTIIMVAALPSCALPNHRSAPVSWRPCSPL
jgi:hypothetical protein